MCTVLHNAEFNYAVYRQDECRSVECDGANFQSALPRAHTATNFFFLNFKFEFCQNLLGCIFAFVVKFAAGACTIKLFTAVIYGFS